MFVKVWNGMVKYVKSQWIQGRAVDTGILGTFFMKNDESNQDVNSEISMDMGKFYYQPSK